MPFLLVAEITIKLMGKILHHNYFRKFFQCYKGPGYPEYTYAAEFITDDYVDNFINERCKFSNVSAKGSYSYIIMISKNYISA